jgi:uncharacterized membrane protein
MMVAAEASFPPLRRINARATLPVIARANRAVYSSEENPMRKVLLIVGILALAVGLLWIGQGTGVIKWPESSFMISQIQWAGYGAALAVLGLVLIWQSKR